MVISNSSNKSSSNNLFFIIALFLFIFNIPLHILHLPFSSGKIIAIVSLIYFLWIIFMKEAMSFKNVFLEYFLKVVCIISVVFFINHLVYSTDSTYYLTIPFFYVIEYLFGSFFLIKIFRINSFDQLVESFLKIGIIQSLIMLSCLFVPPLKTLVLAVMEADPQSHNFSGFETLEAENYFRGFALAADRTLGMSVFLSNVLMLFTLKLYNSNLRYSLFKIIGFCFCFLILSIGGILAARTFFVGLLLNFGMIAYFMFFSSNQNVGLKNVKKYFWGVIIMIIMAIVLVPIAIYLLYPELVEMFELAYNWAFEMFINFFQEGTLETSSSSDLMTNHLSVIPTDLKTILIGDDNRTFNNGIHYMGQYTDSGYLRMLFVFGIVGSLPFYIFWYWVLRKVYKFNSNVFGIGIFLICLGINLFVCQIKYDVFPGSSINFKLIVLFFVFGVTNIIFLKKQNENIISSSTLS